MTIGWKAALVLLALAGVTPHAHAQDDATRRPFVWDVGRAVLIDPTTYAPAILSYAALRQDWRTSQPLFWRGWMETNPRFTASGRPNDVPVSYPAGKRIIRGVALDVLQQSVVHNIAAGVVERLLIARYPQRRTLFRTLSWIERITYGSVAAYQNSAHHFRQAGINRRLARQ